MIEVSNNLFGKVDEYISELLANEDAVLQQVIKSLEENGIENISVSPNQGKLLQVLSKSCQAKHILEIGTLGGYSTIWLARTLPDEGKLITIESDEKCAQIALKNIENAGLSSKVEIINGRALEILPDLIKQNRLPFDLIFIDADKPPYVEYFQMALKLSRPGTIIIADNVIRNGKVLDQDTTDEKVKGVQRLNSFLSGCKEVTATILQTVGVKEYDGMVVAIVNP